MLADDAWMPSALHVGEDEVEGRRHPVELERLDEQGTIAHLASGTRAEEPVQLGVHVAAALRRLVLEAPEGDEIAFAVEHALDSIRPQGADQLVLQVGIAGMEDGLHGPGGSRHAVARRRAATLEAATHV